MGHPHENRKLYVLKQYFLDKLSLAMSKSDLLFSKEKLKSRIHRLVADWPTRLPGLDAIMLVTGSEDDLLTDYRVALHHWLFGLHFTRTVFALGKNGLLIILTNSAKLNHLRRFQGDNCVLMQRSSPYCNRNDALQLKSMVNFLRGHSDSRLTLGTLRNEIPEDALADTMFGLLPTLPYLTVKDCTDGISAMLVKKDDEELMCIKRSSKFACEVMEKMQSRVKTVIAENIVVTNAEVESFGVNFAVHVLVFDL